VSELKQFLEYCSKEYYEGNPVISDEQYDALEERYGELKTPGYRVENGIPHYYPMYSLKKYYDGEDDLPDWVEAKNYIKTDKLDGAALSLLYINGTLVQALNRGDGTKGLDVSNLIMAWYQVPHAINHKDIIQVTGEVVAPSTIENARNYAAGALNLKDKKEFLSRDLVFIAYDSYPNIQDTYFDNCCHLQDLGFKTVLDSHLKDFFPTDGEVYRINVYDCYYRLGYTSKHPRGAFALKQRTEGKMTKLLDVIWQTGKTGKVTPVAILAPIEIDGARVARATLNNPGFIEAMDLKIGDYVMVERAGGIIPRIIKKAELTDENEELLKNSN
jgi:DNA ligase (NAD+)